MATGKTKPTKGQVRKRGKPRKPGGNDPDGVGRKAANPSGGRGRGRASDPVAERIREALAEFENDPRFRLGHYGYTIRRTRGRGTPDFVVEKNVKPR